MTINLSVSVIEIDRKTTSKSYDVLLTTSGSEVIWFGLASLETISKFVIVR